MTIIRFYAVSALPAAALNSAAQTLCSSQVVYIYFTLIMSIAVFTDLVLSGPAIVESTLLLSFLLHRSTCQDGLIQNVSVIHAHGSDFGNILATNRCDNASSLWKLHIFQ